MQASWTISWRRLKGGDAPGKVSVRSRVQDPGSGSRVQGRIPAPGPLEPGPGPGPGYRVQGPDSGSRVKGPGSRVKAPGSRIQGPGFS